MCCRHKGLGKAGKPRRFTNREKKGIPLKRDPDLIKQGKMNRTTGEVRKRIRDDKMEAAAKAAEAKRKKDLEELAEALHEKAKRRKFQAGASA